MTNIEFQVNIDEAISFLKTLIIKQVSEKNQNWFTQKENDLISGFSEKTFFLIFASTPRFMPKDIVHLNDADYQQAIQIREGFCPENWTLDQVTRVIFLMILSKSV